MSPDPLHPDPRSPEGRVIQLALERGYLRPEQLERARGQLRNHPAGKQEGSLLRLLRARYLSEEAVGVMREFYQRAKAEILREAEEAALEVLSISDILIGAPFSISDTGEVEVVPLPGRGQPRPQPQSPAPRPQPPARRPAAEPAEPAEPIVVTEEEPEPTRSGGRRTPLLIGAGLLVLLAALAAWAALR